MLNQFESIEDRMEQISASIRNSTERNCPFCLEMVNVCVLLSHTRLCLFLWEKATDSDHVNHNSHSINIIERECKKRKFEECSNLIS